VFHVYPREGVSVITDRLASEVAGTIEVNSRVEAIYVEEGKVRGVRVAGVDREATTVISTAPVHVLPKLVHGTDALERLSKFRYRAFALVNLRFDTRPVLPEVCTWIPERHYSFFRLTEAPLAMPWLAPEGKTVVTADIGCNVGDEFWTMEEGALGEHCVEQLEQLFPGVRKHYLGCHVLRTAVAHPVYLASYEEDRIALGRGLPIDGLHSIGRNGEFAHILMEDVFWLTRARIGRIFDPATPALPLHEGDLERDTEP
jgi:protoporphyrinogen oxidase